MYSVHNSVSFTQQFHRVFLLNISDLDKINHRNFTGNLKLVPNLDYLFQYHFYEITKIFKFDLFLISHFQIKLFYYF